MNSTQDFVTTKYNLFLSDIKAGLFSTTMPAPTPTSVMATPEGPSPIAPPTINPVMGSTQGSTY